MRRIDLANQLQLSPSGSRGCSIGLEEQGLVAKGACKEDARVSYAPHRCREGEAQEAAPGHVEDIESRLGAVLSEEETETLSDSSAAQRAPRGLQPGE
jgi:hypothetical protein